MAEQLDTSKGWCCDGRTWTEHEKEGGQCCQPPGKQITICRLTASARHGSEWTRRFRANQVSVEDPARTRLQGQNQRWRKANLG